MKVMTLTQSREILPPDRALSVKDAIEHVYSPSANSEQECDPRLEMDMS